LSYHLSLLNMELAFEWATYGVGYLRVRAGQAGQRFPPHRGVGLRASPELPAHM